MILNAADVMTVRLAIAIVTAEMTDVTTDAMIAETTGAMTGAMTAETDAAAIGLGKIETEPLSWAAPLFSSIFVFSHSAFLSHIIY